MSKEKATARPWRCEHNGRRLEIKADTGEWSSMIAQVYKSGRCNANSYRMPADANAELIVTAVNQHDALLSEVAQLRTRLQEAFDYFMGEQACGDFTCACGNVETCGTCEIRELTRAALAGKER